MKQIEIEAVDTTIIAHVDAVVGTSNNNESRISEDPHDTTQDHLFVPKKVQFYNNNSFLSSCNETASNNISHII